MFYVLKILSLSESLFKQTFPLSSFHYLVSIASEVSDLVTQVSFDIKIIAICSVIILNLRDHELTQLWIDETIKAYINNNYQAMQSHFSIAILKENNIKNCPNN